MHANTRHTSFPRILTLASAALSMTVFGTGCGKSAKMSADATAAAWSTDQYVPPTDSRTMAMNAARVLAMPERAADRTMQVGAVSAVIHERPSVTSAPLGMVAAGDALKVVIEADFVRIPATGDYREYIGVGGGDITPSWVKVKAGDIEGWIPARALVNPIEFATSSESLAASRSDTGSKGFSRKVKLEATAMKGAVGTPRLKDANYAAADKMLEHMKSPMKFEVGLQPEPTACRVGELKDIGEDLEKVDPAAAAAVAAAIAKANEPSDFSKGLDIGMSLAGSFVAEANGPEAKVLAEVAKLVEYWSQPYPVTPAEERILGRECLAKMLGRTKTLPETHPVAAYVRWVGAKVAANSTIPYPSMGMDFVVLEDREVNAVAVPGGPVLITTGMLEFLENEDELAAILAHEVTHVEERHGLKLGVDKGLPKLPRLIEFAEQNSKGTFEGLITKTLSDNKLPDFIVKEVPPLVSKELTKILGDILEEATLAIVDGAWKQGDQGVETGADIRGMSLACAAGYDPAALDAALERLKAKTGEYGGANYDDNRAGFERSLLPKFPSVDGSPAVTSESKDGPVVVRKVKPSAGSVERWSKLDAELSRK
jgi:hypothetical protein